MPPPVAAEQGQAAELSRSGAQGPLTAAALTAATAVEWVAALVALTGKRLAVEWASFPAYRLWLDRPAANHLAFTPRDFRPVSAAQGRALLEGRMILEGEEVDIGVRGDPWDMPSPSRRFAVALHQFSWAPHLMAAGRAGEREALRLFVTWRAEFEQLDRFVWGWDVLERRTFNLACAAHRMAQHASEQEARQLARLLARHVRRLADLAGPVFRRAEQLAVACVGAGGLADPVGVTLLRRLLPRLARALDRAISADGGIATRSPEQGLELLYDLLTVDDLLSQRGMAPPAELSRAIEALTATTAFLRLRDGRLARFHGGDAASGASIDSALAQFDTEATPISSEGRGGYRRITSRWIEVMADAAPPPGGPFSVAASDQPLALEVVCEGDRLITQTGWRRGSTSPSGLRLAEGGSTVTLANRSPGRLLSGLRAAGLGPRLGGGTGSVQVNQTETEDGAWLELAHDGWVRPTGLRHLRRLFVNQHLAELRGEDSFLRVGERPGRRPIPYVIRFHLSPDVRVSLARDERSVLIRGPSDRGWWLRNDAAAVALEPSTVCVADGSARRTTQITLRGEIGPSTREHRVRWKLTPVDAGDQGTRQRPAGASE
jgi:uncharacterized heparinase superfamily protein